LMIKWSLQLEMLSSYGIVQLARRTTFGKLKILITVTK
jgi:hypothetical protein